LDEDIFWLRVKKVYDILKPIGTWIYELEGDKPCVSPVPQAFKEIKEHFEKLLVNSPLSKSDEKSTLKSIEKRKEMALTPLHYAANILDPRYLLYFIIIIVQ